MRACKSFMEGKCLEQNCEFDHDDNFCKHFYNGNCKFGDKCRKSHNFKPKNKKKKQKNRRKKNTQSFEPDHSPPDMRLLVTTGDAPLDRPLSERDVIVIPNFFKDREIYNNLLREMENSGFDEKQLWKLWHGDSHLIADDNLGNWKSKCPTFMMVINKMKEYFDMDIKATRFNWYKDNTDWKPYHRDAAAIDERKAKTQNITVAVTFGATRSASFQHMKHKTRIDIPLSDGSIYVFNKQVNIDWMHGIVQEPEINKDGRISIICWGFTEQKK